jgi:hypothetical protein
MITLLTVLYEHMTPCEEILLDSVRANMKHIKQVVIACNDKPKDYFWAELGSPSVIKFGHPIYELYGDMRSVLAEPLEYGHALGMQAALQYADQEYVMFVDPDCFFYPEADEIYLNLMDKHSLNIIGVSHHWATGLGATFFPYIINCMMKRDTLPDENFLKGKLFARPGAMSHHLPDNLEDFEKLKYPMDGKWLIQGPILEYLDRFPNKDNPIFDLSCNLWLWNQDRDGKWLAFQTTNVHEYTTAFYRTNFKLKDKLPKRKILYHLTQGYHNCNKPEAITAYRKTYETAKRGNE